MQTKTEGRKETSQVEIRENHSRNLSNPENSSFGTVNQAETVEIQSVERALMQELMQELNLNNGPFSSSDLFIHKAEGECIHCQLIQQVKMMEQDISKLDFEMQHTHEVLKVKASLNSELKNTIKRLEDSLGREESERKGINCNCGKSCQVF
jgi:hypothetical protein